MRQLTYAQQQVVDYLRRIQQETFTAPMVAGAVFGSQEPSSVKRAQGIISRLAKRPTVSADTTMSVRRVSRGVYAVRVA